MADARLSKNAETTEHKTFREPDEVRKFPKGRLELIKVGGAVIGRAVFEPGWRWMTSLQPLARHQELRGAAFPVSRLRRAAYQDG